jgi:prepilin-type N-terminal cleavage/methylation domain-containing protein
MTYKPSSRGKSIGARIAPRNSHLLDTMEIHRGRYFSKSETRRFNQIMSVGFWREMLTDRRGFSLGEILVAVGVFSILTAIAVPQFIAFRPQNRLNGAARQIFSELGWARAKAVNDNSAYVVTFPTNQTMLITGTTTKTVNIQTEYSDVTLSSSASTITFSSRGTASVAPTITLTNSAGSKTIMLRITGAASIS